MLIIWTDISNIYQELYVRFLLTKEKNKENWKQK